MTDAQGRKQLEAAHGRVWDARQLEEDFEVFQTCAPCVFVRRRSDGVEGLLTFQEHPLFYWGFVQDSDCPG